MMAPVLLFLTLTLGAAVPMKNQDVVDLIGKGVSSRLIVAMIQNSDARFDTSVETILAMRERGVPDDVLEAMLHAAGPPDPSDDGKLMVYVSDSQSWESSGGFGAGEGAGIGYSTGGARPQTAEIIKTFRERCPEVIVTNEQERGDYVVLLDHEGGKALILRDNKVAVFGRNGTSLYSGSTRSLGNAVKDACMAILQAERLSHP